MINSSNWLLASSVFIDWHTKERRGGGPNVSLCVRVCIRILSWGGGGGGCILAATNTLFAFGRFNQSE